VLLKLKSDYLSSSTGRKKITIRQVADATGDELYSEAGKQIKILWQL
jgi:hypothetical protein